MQQLQYTSNIYNAAARKKPATAITPAACGALAAPVNCDGAAVVIVPLLGLTVETAVVTGVLTAGVE